MSKDKEKDRITDLIYQLDEIGDELVRIADDIVAARYITPVRESLADFDSLQIIIYTLNALRPTAVE